MPLGRKLNREGGARAEQRACTKRFISKLAMTTFGARNLEHGRVSEGGRSKGVSCKGRCGQATRGKKMTNAVKPLEALGEQRGIPRGPGGAACSGHGWEVFYSFSNRKGKGFVGLKDSTRGL